MGAVVENTRWLPQGEWDDLAHWLMPENCNLTNWSMKHEQSDEALLIEGGYAVLRSGDAKMMFRCPQAFHHRPAQCDLLHVDLWLNGVNILRDAGTYSYNCDQPWQDYFKSTAAHNTVQFDGHEQMPAVSRFLYGRWPRLEIDSGLFPEQLSATWKDWQNCLHQRCIETTVEGYRITDKIAGFTEKAILRWRLAPEIEWEANVFSCLSSVVKLEVECEVGIRSLQIVPGWESIYYMEKHSIQVWEIVMDHTCRQIVTNIVIR